MNISTALKKQIRRSRWRRFWRRGLGSVALVVVFCTTYMLILPAITITADCGMEEHIHTESCYDEAGELTCERPVHEHHADCFPKERAAEVEEEQPAATQEEAEQPEEDKQDAQEPSEESDAQAPAQQEQEGIPTEEQDSPVVTEDAEETELTEEAGEPLEEEAAEAEFLSDDNNVTISLPNGEEGINASVKAVRSDSTEFTDLQNALTVKLGNEELGVEALYAYQVSLTDMEGEELTLEEPIQVELAFEKPIETVGDVSNWAFYSSGEDKILNDITEEEKTDIALNNGFAVTSLQYSTISGGELVLSENSVVVFDEEAVAEAAAESGILTFSTSYEDITVTATCESGVLPEDAVFSVKLLANSSDEGLSASRQREVADVTRVLLAENIYSYDLTFHDSEGQVIEPNGSVSVEMVFGTPLPTKSGNIALYHNGTVIPANITTNAHQEVLKIQFTVGSFSVFTLVDGITIDPDLANTPERWVRSQRVVNLSVLNHSTLTGGYYYNLTFTAKAGIKVLSPSTTDTTNGMRFYYNLPLSTLDSAIVTEGDIAQFFNDEGAIFSFIDSEENLRQFHLRITKEDDHYTFMMTFPKNADEWGYTTFTLGFWSAGTGGEDISGVLTGNAYAPTLVARKMDANNHNLLLNNAEYKVCYVYGDFENDVFYGVSDVMVQDTYVSGACNRPEHKGFIEVGYSSSNKNGINLLDYDSAYFLQETKAPEGYNIDPMRHWFYYIDTSSSDLSATTTPARAMKMIQAAEDAMGGKEGLDYDVTRLIGYKDESSKFYIATMPLTDKPGYTLPNTGGTGTIWYTFAGSVLIAGAALALYKKHFFSKRRVEN